MNLIDWVTSLYMGCMLSIIPTLLALGELLSGNTETAIWWLLMQMFWTLIISMLIMTFGYKKLQQLLGGGEWLEFIESRRKSKPPIGNLCYPEHRKNLANAIVDRINNIQGGK